MHTKEREQQMCDDLAEALGWVRYVSDPVEHGSVWYKDSVRAPFGPSVRRACWNPFHFVPQFVNIFERYVDNAYKRGQEWVVTAGNFTRVGTLCEATVLAVTAHLNQPKEEQQ